MASPDFDDPALRVCDAAFHADHHSMSAIYGSVGLFNSIMFPTIFSLAVAELGPVTGNGSGILNMAIVGGAILPVIQGVIADHSGIHHAFFLPAICYLYIVFFAVSGSKPNSERYGNGSRNGPIDESQTIGEATQDSRRLQNGTRR